MFVQALPVGPTGELRRRIFDTAINGTKNGNITDIKIILDEMKTSGFTYGADLMHYVYYAALGASETGRARFQHRCEELPISCVGERRGAAEACGVTECGPYMGRYSTTD